MGTEEFNFFYLFYDIIIDFNFYIAVIYFLSWSMEKDIFSLIDVQRKFVSLEPL
jgi:hypothetical protein